MDREQLADLFVLRAVATEGSFTKAALRLGTSQSQVSHVLRRLETGLGTTLIARTTRNNALTEAGARLLEILSPAVERLDTEFGKLRAGGEQPAGTIRIAVLEHAAETILWPALTALVERYPDIGADVTLDYGFNDLIAGRYDAGITLGERIEQDMVAVRIAPDLDIAVVGSPSYFETRARPKQPGDLVRHRCNNLRLSAEQGLYTWEFGRKDRRIKVRVGGGFAFNSIGMLKQAALGGHGLSYLPYDVVQHDVEQGRLVRILENWTQPLSGYHLYYNSRHQRSPILRLLIDALLKRGEFSNPRPAARS